MAVVVACVVVAVVVGVSLVGQSIGSPVTDRDAAKVWGGECSWLDRQAQGACTTSQQTDCELYITGCIGWCAFNCTVAARMVDGTSYFGTIVDEGPCATVTEPDCVFVRLWCGCSGGSSTGCYVSPSNYVSCAL